jgi:hypothetical protein
LEYFMEYFMEYFGILWNIWRTHICDKDYIEFPIDRDSWCYDPPIIKMGIWSIHLYFDHGHDEIP